MKLWDPSFLSKSILEQKKGNKKKEKFNTKISVKYLILSNIDRYNLGTIRDEIPIILRRYYFKLTK